ncbi:MAG: hypothetical protein MUF15_22855 [Acidobacteria bacterium]|nr:hypothetical protein [Acidobacteriota bacterium]
MPWWLFHKNSPCCEVYHHSNRSAYIISHNSSISIPLRTSGEGDYLHISIVSGPGNLEKDI